MAATAMRAARAAGLATLLVLALEVASAVTVLRPLLSPVRTIAFSPVARLRDPTTALWDPATGSWHVWASYKPMNATHVYATNATIRHFVLRAADLTAAGSGVDGTWEDAGDALTASGDAGTFDADAVFTPNAAVECDARAERTNCTWFLWHGGVAGNGPAKTNEERIGLATASSPFGPFTRHGREPVFSAEDVTTGWCGADGAARVDFVVPLILRSVRYLAVKAVCTNFTALPVMYSPVDQSSWLPPYRPSKELGYTDLDSPLVSSLGTCAHAGFEKPSFFIGPDQQLHFLGHNHGNCEAEGSYEHHHLYRGLTAAADTAPPPAWQYGGHFGNEFPAHPFYEPVSVPRDGTGVYGDRPGTGVPEFFLDFGFDLPRPGPWHSNISLMRVAWVAATNTSQSKGRRF